VRERGCLVGATGFTHHLAGMTGTFTTLTSNPKFPTKITQAVAAVADRFPYMVVSNALTNAYVHKNAIPQSLVGMLTLTRIIINCFQIRNHWPASTSSWSGRSLGIFLLSLSPLKGTHRRDQREWPEET